MDTLYPLVYSPTLILFLFYFWCTCLPALNTDILYNFQSYNQLMNSGILSTETELS